MFLTLSKGTEEVGYVLGELQAFCVKEHGGFNLSAPQVPVYKTGIIMHLGLKIGGEFN